MTARPPDDGELDVDALDSRDWRGAGPWDLTEVDLDVEPLPGRARIDLGSMIVTGFGGAELRLQVAEETQQIVSAMLIKGDSALELGAYAAPRSGGCGRSSARRSSRPPRRPEGRPPWSRARSGSSCAGCCRSPPPTASRATSRPGCGWSRDRVGCCGGSCTARLPSRRAWSPPVADLLTAFREVVVRRGEEAKSPGDLLPLVIPADVEPGPESAEDE